MRDTERGRDIGGGRSRLPVGTPYGTLSQDPGSPPERKADAQLLSHPGNWRFCISNELQDGGGNCWPRDFI